MKFTIGLFKYATLLPAWRRKNNRLGLVWVEAKLVLNALPKCTSCGIWYFPSAEGDVPNTCFACEEGKQGAVVAAQISIVNRLLKKSKGSK